MPDLDFRVTGVEPAARGIVPLLHFQLEIENKPETESIHTVIIQAQIQIEAPQRRYAEDEKERLKELFGPPDQWGRTLRNRLWAHAQASAPPFTGKTKISLPVQCTYDMNLASTKYFHALEEGDIPLLFLFSGTVFYEAEDGRLQVQPISWDKECSYRMPFTTWRGMMDQHYPNSVWLFLQKDLFERLYAYKRDHGFATWEQTISRLLNS